MKSIVFALICRAQGATHQTIIALKHDTTLHLFPRLVYTFSCRSRAGFGAALAGSTNKPLAGALWPRAQTWANVDQDDTVSSSARPMLTLARLLHPNSCSRQRATSSSDCNKCAVVFVCVHLQVCETFALQPEAAAGRDVERAQL